MFFITIPVILYQLFFITILIGAGLVGRKTLWTVTGMSLLWTSTHLFFVPLAMFQAMIIIGTALCMDSRISRIKERKAKSGETQAPGELSGQIEPLKTGAGRPADRT